MAITLLGSDRGDFYEYPSWWLAGVEQFTPTYRRSYVVTSGSSWTITYSLHNGNATAADYPAASNDYFSRDAIYIAAGADGDVTVTYYSAPAGATATTDIDVPVGFGGSGIRFANGLKQTANLHPVWAKAWDPASGDRSRIGGYGAFPVSRLADLWNTDHGPDPIGTPDYGDYTQAGVPLHIPPKLAGGLPDAIESVSVTNGAGGWSADIGAWWSTGGSPDPVYGLAPRVTYTPPGNDPGPDSWTYVDVTLRDDWTVGDLYGVWGDLFSGYGGDYVVPDSVTDGNFRLTTALDEATYAMSVGRLTTRFIAYHGAVPTLPSEVGWTLGLRIGGGAGWHVTG